MVWPLPMASGSEMDLAPQTLPDRIRLGEDSRLELKEVRGSCPSRSCPEPGP